MPSGKTPLIASAAMAVATPAAFAHAGSGWAALHWHASDFLGLASVATLAAAALWLARRQKRGAKK